MIIPEKLFNLIKKLYVYIDRAILVIRQPIRYKRTIRKLKQKKKIKVAFFLLTDSVWKLDELYHLMKKSEKFDPIIVICPWTIFSNEESIENMLKVEQFCIRRRYKFLNTYDNLNDKWVDVKKTLNPDIIFFTYPYDFTRKIYRIRNFLDKLTCYATYGFNLDNKQQRQFNMLFHNVMWKGFYETSHHKTMAIKYAYNKGTNVEVSGFPLFDEMKKRQEEGCHDVWKIKNKNIKRIIWAPHHTIDDLPDESHFSCFLLYSNLFKELAQKYKSEIQIAFKPHPKLKSKLYNQVGWGKEITDNYYQQWNNIENGQLETGDYIDLFLSSDAIILDSISFICEYMYTIKPILFTMRDEITTHKFNEFGQIAFENTYQSHNEKEIEDFINDVILNGNDSMFLRREKFYSNFLKSPQNNTASLNIFNSLIKII